MSRQTWVEGLAWATASGTAVGNSTAEAIVFPNLTVPANYLADGRTLRGSIYGQISNVVTATPTVSFRIRLGGVAGTVLAASAAITTSATAFTAAIFQWDFTITTRVNGSSGSLFTMGAVSIANDTAPQVRGMGSAGATTPAAVTVDLTADQALSVTAQWSAANAANTLTGHVYTLESLN
jgi:hypothetical protein